MIVFLLTLLLKDTSVICLAKYYKHIKFRPKPYFNDAHSEIFLKVVKQQFCPAAEIGIDFCSLITIFQIPLKQLQRLQEVIQAYLYQTYIVELFCENS